MKIDTEDLSDAVLFAVFTIIFVIAAVASIILMIKFPIILLIVLGFMAITEFWYWYLRYDFSK